MALYHCMDMRHMRRVRALPLSVRVCWSHVFLVPSLFNSLIGYHGASLQMNISLFAFNLLVPAYPHSSNPT